MRGKLFPQRCDISPDGTYLAYLATKYLGRRKETFESQYSGTYQAVSRLPWLTALAIWPASTYSSGFSFGKTRLPKGVQVGQKVVRDSQLKKCPFLLYSGSRLQFKVENLHGWTPSPESAPRKDGDMWDEHRRVVMHKVKPDNPRIFLQVSGGYAAFRSSFGCRQTNPTEFEEWYSELRYEIQMGEETQTLSEVQWADWSAAGDLLVATWSGDLRILSGTDLSTCNWEYSLADIRPNPIPSPSWAKHWKK